MEERSLLFEYLAVVKRRRWLIAVPIALGLLVGVVLVQTLPREYRSSTTLAVTSPNMTTELVKSSPLDLAERARAISQQSRFPTPSRRSRRYARSESRSDT